MTQRQLLISGLALITVVIGAFSTYVGIQLSNQDTAVAPSSAAVACGPIQCFNQETGVQISDAGEDCKFNGGSCDDRARAFCGNNSYNTSSNPSSCQDTGNGDENGDNNDGGGSSCVINYNGNSFSVSSGCAGKNISTFTGSSCPTTSRDVGDAKVPSGGGTYTANPAPGECQQVDHDFGGIASGGNQIGAGGVCSCNTTEPPVTTTTYNCSSNFQCVSVSGSGGTYSSASACSTACKPPVTVTEDPVCGDSCDPTDGTSCPNDHTCNPNTNTCELNTCFANPELCNADLCTVAGVDPVCGDTCNPEDATSCPNDHTCSEDTNTCVLNSCITGDAECDENSCAVLPETAFGLEEGNPYLVLAIVMLVSGGIFFLLRDVPYLQRIFVSLDYKTGMLKLNVSREKKVKSSRNKFEDKFR